MKKLIAVFFSVMLAVIGAVNCFAYTKFRDLAYIDELGKFVPYGEIKPENINEISYDTYYGQLNGGDFRTHIVTNEYKFINGNAMVKVRDIVAAVGGSIEYNPKTKATKAYIPNFSQTFNSVRAFSITPGKSKVDFTVVDYPDENRFYESYDFKIAPMIIDGSLYVSAIDLGEILGNYCAYDNTHGKYWDVFNYGEFGVPYKDNPVRLVKGIIYMKVYGYLP